MAARWRGENGDLNAGNSDFLGNNTPDEVVLSQCDEEGVHVDTQSCMDHSILAIFEDSTVTSEDKSGVEEESDTLLSALTEMLDSVEDDDGTLSPFDTLPDTKLLTHPERRDSSVVGAHSGTRSTSHITQITQELSLSNRLRPRSKSPNVTSTVKIDREKEDKSKTERNSPPQLLKPQTFHSKHKRAEAEVEVFTSASLVNLVKLMHPYCLRLHVEEQRDKVRKNHTVFSQEEVWKYERPSEESDEEINVVSDDEVKDTKEEEERDEKRDNGVLLKSALLNGSSSRKAPSREKKRVSFGPVQVASFDDSVERGLNEGTNGHTCESVSLNTKALEPQTPSSEMNKAQVLPLKGETKAKSLSLQQYRQLRLKRRPLVEKQGNYTTKWPSVPEPPKELTPILCLQGQRHNSCEPKAAQHYPDHIRNAADRLQRFQTPGHKTHYISALPRPPPSDTNPSTHLHHSRLKCPRTETEIISPASPQPHVTANPNVSVPESKKTPVKKPTLVSSDPPNPVLLPLPVSQTTTTDLSSSEPKEEFLNRAPSTDGTTHFPGIQNEYSGTSLQRQPSSSGPKPELMLVNQDLTQTCSPSLIKETKLDPSPHAVRQFKCPSLKPYVNQPPAPVDAPIPVMDTLLELHHSVSSSEEPPPAPQFGCIVQSAAADSGIEAPDLTSLLEQFEETQAKEERVCENELEPKLAASPSKLQKDEQGDLDKAQPVDTLEPLSTSESPGNPETLRNSPHLQMSDGADIPEPLGNEIILSTQQDLPARRKNPSSKAIQIIDPRPLPSKKTHTNLSELPAAQISPHTASSVSSDHDYCGPVDSSLTSAAQRSRASKPKDVSKTSDEFQVTNNQDSIAAAGGKNQTPTCEVNTTTRAAENSAKSLTQQLCDQPRTRSETSLSADKVLPDSTTSERDCCHAAEDKTAPCTLPTPPPSPPARGRDRRRYRRRSPRSDSSSSSRSSSSSSSSASPSPKRQKHRHKSSSCSSSPPSRSISRSPPRRYRWSYSRSRHSRSRSRSWSQSRSPSRSRSPSPQVCQRQWREVYRRDSRKLRREHEIRIQKLKAIDERRVVYVGRIRKSMTHNELRERFSQFGDVECVSLHFRDRGDHYGFVTFYNMHDAFAAIDNGSKLRKPDELPFDICFGGRRQFCNSDYADLDANRDAEPSPAKSRFEDMDFDSLLKQAQRGLKR